MPMKQTKHLLPLVPDNEGQDLDRSIYDEHAKCCDKPNYNVIEMKVASLNQFEDL
jgi:hypothetical protein